MTTINATSYSPAVNSLKQSGRSGVVKSAETTSHAEVSNIDTVHSKQKPIGKDKLKLDIKQGKANFSSGVWNFIIGGTFKGDIYITVPKGTPMSTIKQMYNLPDGALRNYCRTAGCPGGDMDRFETIANEVWFSAESFAKGNNMTLEEVKALFNK